MTEQNRYYEQRRKVKVARYPSDVGSIAPGVSVITHPGDECRYKVATQMCHSETGTHWLAGQIVTILETDEGEYWEPCIVKVRGINSHGKTEKAWINEKDLCANYFKQTRGGNEMQNLNRYADDKAVKWLVVKRHYNGEWVIRYVSLLDTSPTLEKILDETPLGEMAVSEFAVFKNRPNFGENKKRRYYRGCDVPVYFNAALGSLINARESDWF